MPEIQDPRLEKFARHYAVHRHGPQAIAEAGLGDTVTAAAVLNNRLVKARVKELWGEAVDAAQVTPERVVQELCRVAFADVRRLYDESGNLKAPHDFDDDTAAAVVAIDVETRWERDGDNAVPVVTKKIRRADKMAALTILAKHVKVIGDESDGVNALASALADRLKAARRRSNLDAEDARIIDPQPAAAIPLAPPTAQPVPATQESHDEVLW